MVRIAGPSSSDVWALTMRNAYSEQWSEGDAAIWHFDGGSWSREQTSAGQTIRDILVLSERVFVATGSGGVLHRER